MYNDLFYPISLLFEFFSRLDNEIIWGLLFISLGFNFYYSKLNKQLRLRLKKQHYAQLERQQQESHQKKSTHTEINNKPIASKIQLLPEKNEVSDLSAFEEEMNDSLWLDDNESKINQPINVSATKTIESETMEATLHEDKRFQGSSVEHKSSLMDSWLASFSGWHKSLVPFLLQNIGWFIGILCFISGSIFFISYTEGFNKSITIFYTVLSYTLLLAFGGYRLKSKVSHASTSGYVLMAISFLLIPLNFSSDAQLLTSSTENYQFVISGLSTLLALLVLYYVSRLISGVFNRQLLQYFTPVFFALSIFQLLVPWIQNSHSLIFLMGIQVAILTLLLWALIDYMPALLKQVFTDNHYLLLMSVGSLIYAALISIIHLTLSSPVAITLSYYAPLVLLISAALFYIDGQLNDYKERMNLLSYFSFISYGLSFLAIALSLNDDPVRNITLFMAVLLYGRLVWLYRSLAPLYLMMGTIGFLYFDVILSHGIFSIPGVNTASVEQWYYLATLPLIGFFSLILLFLRKSELQSNKQFSLTKHLFHTLILTSIALSTFSQWLIALNHYGTSTELFLNIVNSLAIMTSCFYWLKSKQLKTYQCLENNSIFSLYLYVFLLLPVLHILLGFQEVLSIDIKMLMITVLIFFYSLNSRFNIMAFDSADAPHVQSEQCHLMNKEWFTNASLLLSVLVLVLVASDFSLSIKTGLLIFIISINFLLLSLNLLNQLLFYVFMIVLSAAILTVKLYLNHPHSTGLLVVSCAFAIFYLIHWLDKKKNNERELLQLEAKKQSNPEFILWFYPANDFSIQSQEMKNV